MPTTSKTPQAKPETVKIVHTEGGYACYDLKSSIHPSVVFTKELDVLDWLADRLAAWAGIKEGA